MLYVCMESAAVCLMVSQSALPGMISANTVTNTRAVTMPKINKPQYYKKEHQRRAALRLWYEDCRAVLCCSECGESHPAILDFHHKDPKTKKYDISQMIGKGYAKKSILKEMMKCDILCSNCHRIFHYNEKMKGRLKK